MTTPRTYHLALHASCEQVVVYPEETDDFTFQDLDRQRKYEKTAAHTRDTPLSGSASVAATVFTFVPFQVPSRCVLRFLCSLALVMFFPGDHETRLYRESKRRGSRVVPTLARWSMRSRRRCRHSPLWPALRSSHGNSLRSAVPSSSAGLISKDGVLQKFVCPISGQSMMPPLPLPHALPATPLLRRVFTNLSASRIPVYHPLGFFRFCGSVVDWSMSSRLGVMGAAIFLL